MEFVIFVFDFVKGKNYFLVVGIDNYVYWLVLYNVVCDVCIFVNVFC